MNEHPAYIIDSSTASSPKLTDPSSLTSMDPEYLRQFGIHFNFTEALDAGAAGMSFMLGLTAFMLAVTSTSMSVTQGPRRMMMWGAAIVLGLGSVLCGAVAAGLQS